MQTLSKNFDGHDSAGRYETGAWVGGVSSAAVQLPEVAAQPCGAEKAQEAHQPSTRALIVGNLRLQEGLHPIQHLRWDGLHVQRTRDANALTVRI